MTLFNRIRRVIRPGSTSHWILSGFYRSPIGFAVALGRSLICTKKLCGRYGPIRVRVAAGQKFSIQCSPSQRVQVEGILSVIQWGGLDSPSSLTLGSESNFTLLGDFEIGPGVHILVSPRGSLRIGGRLEASASGITCNSRIMVEESVEIGRDCIIAWDVYVSDSDWHNIRGAQRTIPVSIGDCVWITHGVSILKGAVVPTGCIVGAKSVVNKAIDSERALIAGVPAVIRKTGVEWSR